METLSIYILKSAGLLCLFYMLYFLLLKNDTSFIANRKFLLGGILASAILPAIYFTKTVIVNAPIISYSQFSTATVVPAQETQPTDWWLIVGVIYLSISAFFVLQLLFRSVLIFRTISKNKSYKKDKYTIVETSQASGPYSFFNYIFINTKAIKEDELSLMLNHEKVHADQLHSIDMLLANLLTAVLWFNPLSWFYKKVIEQNLEFIADHETAYASECIQQYQHILVKVSTNIHQPALVNHFYQSFIKKRIVMLNKKNNSAKTTWKYQLILPLIAVFMMSFNIKTTTKIIDNNSSTSNEVLLQNESLSVTINQTTLEESLERFKSIFLKWDAELNFSNIKYTQDGKIITAIEVSLKNLKTGKTEFLNRSNSSGILPFEIYVNKNKTSGFRDITKEEDAHKTAALQLKEIGKNPLYIISDKQYSSSDLDGKTVRTSNVIEILKPKDARKSYGSKASEGAILVSEGKIIDDFKEELKLIDKENKKEAAYFIEIKKNELPVFISLSNNPSSKNTIKKLEDLDNSIIDNSNKDDIAKPLGYGVKVQYTPNEIDTISRTRQIINVRTKNGNQIKWIEKDSLSRKNGFKISDTMDVYIMDNSKNVKQTTKALFVLDGKVQDKNFNANNIDPENIAHIKVIKGTGAIEKYGKKASEGAIEITTKSNTGTTSNWKDVHMHVIHKDQNDISLKNLRNMIKNDANIDAEFSNIKRNSEGIITSIKIKAETKEGKKASASFSNSEGIPMVIIGLDKNNQLIVSSNYKNN